MTATGIGSLPGEDIDAATALVFDALPDLPHLPELPARGAGAAMTGRTAAALADLPVDLQPSGWRLVGRAGLDQRRALELLERDIDAVLPVAPGHDGLYKVQLTGPWSLVAALQLPRGGAVLGDRGAVADVVASLAETAALHLADVRRRLPHAHLLLQLDEPALPAVMAGGVPTESGMHRLAAVDPIDVRSALGEVIAGAGDVPVVVHCCAADVPVALFHEAGAAAVSFDLEAAQLDLDEVAELVERGLSLWCGAVPALGPGVPPAVRSVADGVRLLWRRLGLPVELLPERVVVTPACGLAGASAGWASTALRLVQQVARALAEAPEVAPR